MSAPDVTITRSLPESVRAAAVDVFVEAFGEKMSTALPDPDRRRAFVARTLAADHCITALDGESFLGFAGLKAATGHYAGGVVDARRLGFGEARRLLGMRGAIKARVAFGLVDHRPKPRELYIENIVVAPEARGKGIGTRLLAEIETIAREDGFERIWLDVVDTNPRARVLYEREGYKVIKEQKLYFMSRFAGFSVVRTMELAVGADEPSAG